MLLLKKQELGSDRLDADRTERILSRALLNYSVVDSVET